MNIRIKVKYDTTPTQMMFELVHVHPLIMCTHVYTCVCVCVCVVTFLPC